MVWAIGLSALTTIGLGLLTWGMVIMHALVSGVDGLIGQGDVEAVDPQRYELALVVGAAVNLLGAPTFAWLASRTPARGWPPPAQGAVAALLAGVIGLWALLRILGIGLLDVLLALAG